VADDEGDYFYYNTVRCILLRVVLLFTFVSSLLSVMVSLCPLQATGETTWTHPGTLTSTSMQEESLPQGWALIVDEEAGFQVWDGVASWMFSTGALRLIPWNDALDAIQMRAVLFSRSIWCIFLEAAEP
jgi:hypothetical protein